ncbi:MAG: hypothetical protein OM95_14670 [Bdellovibrio sp. ArHS]|uniref:hypothetical protein n=1 Tax=Bdellovibrio sp. ArHS TaxID=1569284 RepID=UPI000582BA93|nr:hypothetical protein [Bdellovibrio sp. ArHS]KHD87424.1 MAG: hypothetical protein OM95_14670 [Bdellovibrio sp. ArHS]
MAPLSDLSALSKQLNEATDEANQTLKNFESQLMTLNLGITAEAVIQRTEIPFSNAKSLWPDRVLTSAPCYELMSLGWVKVGGKWGLKLLSEIYQKSETANASDEVIFREAQAISNLSRQNRFLAINNLEKLVAALKEAGDKLLTDVERAKKYTATL